MGRGAIQMLVAAVLAVGGVGACSDSGRVACENPTLGQESTRPSFDAAPDPSLVAGSHWEATVSTTCGDVVVLLDGAAAPRAVASFVQLAQSGYWQDSRCDRLTARLAPSRVLQCGDSPGKTQTPPGYELRPESVPAGHRYERGMVGMVTPDFHRASAGEFFFVYEDFTAAPGTVGEPAIVGRVVSGIEVIDAIADAGVEDGVSDWHPFINVGVRSVTVGRR